METTANIWRKKNRTNRLSLMNFLSRFHKVCSKHNLLLINSICVSNSWKYSLKLSVLAAAKPKSVISGTTLGKRKMFNTWRNRMVNLVLLLLVVRWVSFQSVSGLPFLGRIYRDERSIVLVTRKCTTFHGLGKKYQDINFQIKALRLFIAVLNKN